MRKRWNKITGRFVIGAHMLIQDLLEERLLWILMGDMDTMVEVHFRIDCTKVDRSAAYAARYVVKNVVTVRLADQCE